VTQVSDPQLWACIYLPQLPLLVAQQRLAEPLPLLIETTQRQRRLVAFANDVAQAAGIQVGMTIATALSLVDTATVQAADVEQEERALQRLAVALYQFSPHIHQQRADSLLIELSGSLRLFNGAESLAAQMQHCVGEQLGHFKLAYCSNPLAALLLARSAFTPPNSAALYDLGQIDVCTVCDLELTPAQRDRLVSMGINRVGELLALPRDALGRRFGKEVITYLNQLQGLAPSPRHCFHLPETFAQDIEFLQEVDRAGQLLFPLQRLISYLEQFLRVRQQALTELELSLRLREQPGQPTPQYLHLHLPLASADYRSSHIMPLLQLKLERLHLPAPVLAIAVRAERFVALSVQQQDLLSTDQVPQEDRFHLLDRLKARLGDQQVIGLVTVDDHRPELCWQAIHPRFPADSRMSGFAADNNKVRRKGKGDGKGKGKGKGETRGIAEQVPLYGIQQRPCWLLPKPLPLGAEGDVPVYGVALQLLSAPERIETGWWDGHSVNRDYYIARHASGARYWVFYDREQCRWFLHGVFG
jgi:protein ImuB